jgi:hypothetical protein
MVSFSQASVTCELFLAFALYITVGLVGAPFAARTSYSDSSLRSCAKRSV